MVNAIVWVILILLLSWGISEFWMKYGEKILERFGVKKKKNVQR